MMLLSNPSNSEVHTLIQQWIQEEDSTALFGVLSTLGSEGAPKARIVAVREINEEGLLFFTQKSSNKVREMEQCHSVCMTLFLARNQRQIIFEGSVRPLDPKENDDYWASYPKIGQIRFGIYGPSSGTEIESNQALDQRLEQAMLVEQDKTLERPEAYVGYRILPATIKLYQLNLDRMSDSLILSKKEQDWILQRVVP